MADDCLHVIIEVQYSQRLESLAYEDGDHSGGDADEPVYKFSTGQEMLEKSREIGWDFVGFEVKPYLVKVLHGLPKFKDLCGPVADGVSAHGVTKILYPTLKATEFIRGEFSILGNAYHEQA